MKDKDGFIIKCKHTTWQYENDEPEFVCGIFGRGGYCYGDENCPRYEAEGGESCRSIQILAAEP